MTTLLTILFDGIAYGMLLFVLACGLAVTLGLMNFVNLAHGAFAMAGGYVCATLVNTFGWPFAAGQPMAFLASAAVGLVFMAVTVADYIMGSSQTFIRIPEALQGQINLFGVGIGRYRLMIIVI